MSDSKVHFVADGKARLERANGRTIDQIEREIRARFEAEMSHAGLFDRMRIEAKIQKEIRTAVDRAAPRPRLEI
jgi:hypothetical protein